jgi:hypothetical protein
VITYQPSISNTPSHDTKGISSGANGQREDLCGVNPWHGQPRRTKSGGEDEDHRGRGSTIRGCFAHFTSGLGVNGESGKSTCEEHGNSLDYRSPIQRPSAADAVKGEDAD